MALSRCLHLYMLMGTLVHPVFPACTRPHPHLIRHSWAGEHWYGTSGRALHCFAFVVTCTNVTGTHECTSVCVHHCLIVHHHLVACAPPCSMPLPCCVPKGPVYTPAVPSAPHPVVCHYPITPRRMPPYPLALPRCVPLPRRVPPSPVTYVGYYCAEANIITQ